MKRVIELIRVSTESQAREDRVSIPAQRAVNQRTASVYGLTIVRSIEISDVSGASVLMAPEIRELITLITDPTIHGVVVREFSRLMRPDSFDLRLLQAFAETNTLLYLQDGPIDFSNKTGRFFGTIRAAIAGMEREEIKERIFSAKEEKRKRGGFAQSKICLPFGVDFRDNKWCYTAEAALVKEAFRLLLSGDTSYTSIGRKVGIEAYNLRVILRNPIYTGWRVIDKRRDLTPAGKYPTKDGRQGDRKKMTRAPEDIIRVKVLEPLISEAEFAQAQAIMSLKKKNYWRTRGDHHRFTYNGYLRCAYCQSLIYTKFRRRDYYVCKNGRDCDSKYMRRELLESELDTLFRERLTDIEFLKSIFAAAKQSSFSESTVQLDREFQSLLDRRERILNAYFAGHITEGERDIRLQEVKRKQDAISELEMRRPVPVATDIESLAELFMPFVEFDLLGRDDKRKLLNTLAPEIEIADYIVRGITIGPDVSHTDRDSSLPPA